MLADGPHGTLADDELRAVIANFPIHGLAALPGIGLDHATVDALVRRFATP